MGQRRMFSPDIICSDDFLEMPPTSRDLYIQLAIRADDDGFVQPKSVMRILGSAGDDIKILIGKRFLIPFESGVVVIKHWLIHNMIRKDRYHETRFIEERNLLQIKDNNAYTEIGESQKKEPGNQMATKWQPRLGKDRLGKDREEEREEPTTQIIKPKKTENSIDYLKAIPDEDMKEFTARFDATPKQLQSKAEDLLNYCKSKGKTYRNYKAFLLNALKRDFKEMTEEERARREELASRLEATKQLLPSQIQQGRDSLLSKMKMRV